MCYRKLPSHPIGEYQIDFISLISLRLRVFAVNNGMDAHYPKRHQSAKVVVQ